VRGVFQRQHTLAGLGTARQWRREFVGFQSPNALDSFNGGVDLQGSDEIL